MALAPSIGAVAGGSEGARVVGTAHVGLLQLLGAPANTAKASRRGERAQARPAMAMRRAQWHGCDSNMRLCTQQSLARLLRLPSAPMDTARPKGFGYGVQARMATVMAGHNEAIAHPHRAKGGSFPSIRDTNKPKNWSTMTKGHGGVHTTARHAAELW